MMVKTSPIVVKLMMMIRPTMVVMTRPTVVGMLIMEVSKVAILTVWMLHLVRSRYSCSSTPKSAVH